MKENSMRKLFVLFLKSIGKKVRTMDEMVLKVQEWVNTTYRGRYGFDLAPTNGQTGWSTMYSLTRALQIELGISQPVNNFGDGTASAYKQWGEMSLGNVPTDEKGRNIVKILQGAMYCKGYSPGGFTGTFGEGTRDAVIKLQTDAGLPIRDGKVYAYIFKAFLTMDAYVLTSGGDSRIRDMQRNLNYNYYKTAGVQPADGHYQRNTNKALIYGLQTEIGIAPSSQTGSIGPATTAGLPTLNLGSSGNFVKLFQYALYVNNFDPGAFDGQYGSGVKSIVAKFQQFVGLTADGIAGKQTWLSALVSTGDPNRKGTACDCVTTITPSKAQALKNAGYQTIGRYLTNASPMKIDKKIKPGELETIFNAGLTVFPIYQTTGAEAEYFYKEQGKLDAQRAVEAAQGYGFKRGTTIYFSVDFDAYETDITNNILPHFQGINEQMNYLDNYYKIGIYGPRNVCIQVSKNGWASTSFVSGMSTGFSANLGYPLPDNWAFDQISTISVNAADGKIEIDNNIKSGKDNGATSVELSEDVNSGFFKQLGEIQLLALQYANGDVAYANKLTTNYYRRVRYESEIWTLTSGEFNKDFEEFVHNSVGQNSFIYINDPVTRLTIDTPHMLATISALLYANLPLVGTTQQDLAGWGGDLFTVSIDVYNHRNEATYTGDINEKTYKAAYEYIGTKTLDGNFTYEDFAGDVDAVNIASMLLADSTKPILSAVQEYYESQVFTRYSRFIVNKFNGNTDTMRKNAEDIMVSENPDIKSARQALRGSMGMSAPYYTTSEGIIMGNAFADKIIDLSSIE